MKLLQWLRKVYAEPQLDAEACFNVAQRRLSAGNKWEALMGVSRVLQLTPNHETALVLRERLATDLRLDELDRAARVLEEFAYSHCGPGHKWKVELRRRYALNPHGRRCLYDAAFLDLCQDPPAFIELTLEGNHYTVRLMVNRPVSGVSPTCLSEVTSQSIPAQADALLKLLDRFIEIGLLVKLDGSFDIAQRVNE